MWLWTLSRTTNISNNETNIRSNLNKRHCCLWLTFWILNNNHNAPFLSRGLPRVTFDLPRTWWMQIKRRFVLLRWKTSIQVHATPWQLPVSSAQMWRGKKCQILLPCKCRQGGGDPYLGPRSSLSLYWALASLHKSFFLLLLKVRLACISCKSEKAGAGPGFGQGGPRLLRPKVANVVKRSHMSKVSNLWLGSRACLRALEAFGFLRLKYAFSHILETLFL